MKANHREWIDNNRVSGLIEEILHHAGVTIHGLKPHNLHIYDELLLNAVLNHGSPGLREVYMNGWQGAGLLGELMFRLIQKDSDEYTKAQIKMQWLMLALRKKSHA